MDARRTPQEGRWCGEQEGLLPLEQQLLSLECYDQGAKLWWALRVQTGEASGMLPSLLR